MRTVIVYESMYGNTHHVAESIAEAATGLGEVALVSVSGATPEVLAGADFVFVGGPTHVHGMTSATSRHGAVADADKKHLELDPDAEGPGLREWFDAISEVKGTPAAAFDTRMEGPPAFTGRASKGIGKRLHRHGFRLIDEPESFLVNKENHLIHGEAERARLWATEVLASR